jgi:hypothetical protein
MPISLLKYNVSENKNSPFPVPLYHCFGRYLGVLGCRNSQRSNNDLQAETFDAGLYFKTISEEKQRPFFGVPNNVCRAGSSPNLKTI